MSPDKWARAANILARPQTPEDRARLAPILVTALLGVATLAELTHITVTLARSSGSSAQAPLDSTPGRAPERNTRLIGANIIAAHLFGDAASQVQGQPREEEAATSLVLTGIVAMSDPRRGLAMLGTDGVHARLVPAGADVSSGTTLTDVYPDHVILRQGERRLALRLPRDQLAQSSVHRAALTAPRESLAQNEDPTAASDTASAEDQQRLTAVTLYSALHLRATSVDGVRGERIMNVVDNVKPLATLGLVPGDVILEINGAPIESPYADLEKALQNGRATLSVARNGERMLVALDPTMATAAATLARRSAPR